MVINYLQKDLLYLVHSLCCQELIISREKSQNMAFKAHRDLEVITIT